MQFIGTKVRTLIQKVGETVILPGYIFELAFTNDAVIRLELGNNDNFSTSYKITAFQNNLQSVETVDNVLSFFSKGM